MKPILRLCCVLLCVLIACSGCAAKSSSRTADVNFSVASNSFASVGEGSDGWYDASAPQIEPDIDSSETFTADAGGGLGGAVGELSLPADERKVILSADVTLEAKNYDEALQTLLSSVSACGGYLASREDYSYSARETVLSVRVPSERFDGFLGGLGEIANVVYLSQSSDDITESYVETESYLASLNTQQERLLQLMEQASSLEELLQIEDRLAEVRAQLQYYASLKNSYDSRVQYSTISLRLSEVRDYTVNEPTFGEQLLLTLKESGRSFVLFLQDLLFLLIHLLPYLLILAVALPFAVRALRRRKARRQAARDSAAAPTAKPADPA